MGRTHQLGLYVHPPYQRLQIRAVSAGCGATCDELSAVGAPESFHRAVGASQSFGGSHITVEASIPSVSVAECPTARTVGRDDVAQGEDSTRDSRALARGMRLFRLYVAAGGALCMRPAVWRRLMVALHPDKGGDVVVFQHISSLKREVDQGQEIPDAIMANGSTPPDGDELHDGSAGGDDQADDALYCRLRQELWDAAQSMGPAVFQALPAL